MKLIASIFVVAPLLCLAQGNFQFQLQIAADGGTVQSNIFGTGFVDMENGSTGVQATTTIATNSTYGFLGGSWSDGGNNHLMWVSNINFPLLATAAAGTNTYTGTGTRCWAFDLSTNSSFLRYTFPGSLTKVSMGAFMRFPCGTTYENYNFMGFSGSGIGAGIAFVDDVASPKIGIEQGTSDYTTTNVAALNNRLLWATVYQENGGFAATMFYDGATGDLLWSNGLAGASGPMTSFYLGRFDAHTDMPNIAGYLLYDSVVWSETGKWPMPPTGNWLPAYPVVSSVASGNLLATTADITWTTDIPTDSTVNYGTTSSYGSTTNLTNGATSHTVTLAGLSPSTTYFYQVQSDYARLTTTSNGPSTFATASSCSAWAGQSCTIDNDFETVDDAWAQRLDLSGGGGTICQVDMKIYKNSGTPQVAIEFWSTPDTSGTKYGTTSNTNTISSTSTGNTETFTWPAGGTLPPLPASTSVYLQIRQVAAGARFREDSATPNGYDSTTYSTYHNGSQYVGGAADMDFVLYKQ